MEEQSLEQRIDALADRLDALENARVGIPADQHEGHIDILFDGPPGPEGGRFVEVENAKGENVKLGRWVERRDGLWALRVAAGALGGGERDQEHENAEISWLRRQLEDIAAAHERGVQLYAESGPLPALPPDRAMLVSWLLGRLEDERRDHASHVGNIQHATNHAIAEAEARVRDLERFRDLVAESIGVRSDPGLIVQLVSEMYVQNRRLRGRIVELESDVAHRGNRLAEADKRIAELDATVGRQADTISKLQADPRASLAVEGAERELAAARAKLDQMTSAVADRDALIGARSQDLQAARTDRFKLEGERDRLEAVVKNQDTLLLELLDQLNGKIDALAESWRDLDATKRLMAALAKWSVHARYRRYAGDPRHPDVEELISACDEAGIRDGSWVEDRR